MKDRIKLSENATYLLYQVKQRLDLRAQDDYVPMRIAVGRSLQSKQTAYFPAKMDIEDQEKRGRKEVQLSTFEQQQGLFFRLCLVKNTTVKLKEMNT